MTRLRATGRFGAASPARAFANGMAYAALILIAGLVLLPPLAEEIACRAYDRAVLERLSP